MHKQRYHSTKALQLTVVIKRKVRKHLNGDTLLKIVKKDFQEISDKRYSNSKINLDDALMSALAMFQLKSPSLLAFDKRRIKDGDNLRSIFGINDIPCDSQMRTILDPLSLSSLRAPFLTVFRQIQRGKEFEKLAYLDGHYLLSGDGTGFYSSEKVSSSYCMSKKHKNGTIQHHLQMYAASFVCPDYKVVIPVFPEMIRKADGASKNDCERNASKRFFKDFRREHPHLKVIVVEDALASNGPHIEELQKRNLRFILGAKPKGNKEIFTQLTEAVADASATEIKLLDPKDRSIGHFFTFKNRVSLNKSHPNILVNVLDYCQIGKNDKMIKFTWITDIEITEGNVYKIMRAGRARWKIENETFNTLKNQGYNLGHNYGLGKKNLSGIFTILMMLAFLIDQVQQLSCWLFQAALEEAGSKRALWEGIRSYYRVLQIESMEQILRAIAYEPNKPRASAEYKT